MEQGHDERSKGHRYELNPNDTIYVWGSWPFYERNQIGRYSIDHPVKIGPSSSPYPRHSMGLIIYAAPLTPLAPPQLIGSPMAVPLL